MKALVFRDGRGSVCGVSLMIALEIVDSAVRYRMVRYWCSFRTGIAVYKQLKSIRLDNV